MPEAVGTSKECFDQNVSVRVIDPRDADQLNHIATKLALPAMASFWEDRMRQDPVAMFGMLFSNPAHAIAFDIGDGDGVLAYLRQFPIHRANLFGASWGKRASRCPKAWRKATAAAMLALDVHMIEGITAESNKRSRRAMESAEMKFVCRIPDGLWYNEKQVDGVVYELRREDLGLEPQ